MMGMPVWITILNPDHQLKKEGQPCPFEFGLNYLLGWMDDQRIKFVDHIPTKTLCVTIQSVYGCLERSNVRLHFSFSRHAGDSDTLWHIMESAMKCPLR